MLLTGDRIEEVQQAKVERHVWAVYMYHKSSMGRRSENMVYSGIRPSPDHRLYLAFHFFCFPFLVKFVIPRHPNFGMLRQYRDVHFVVLYGAVYCFTVQALHVSSDHRHLLPYADNLTA